MSARPKILMLGYLPPPFFGPSVTYQSLMRSEFSRKFDVTFVDITVASSVQDIEQFRFAKLVRMVRLLTKEFWLLLTRRYDFCSCPVSVNRNAFLKDAMFLALARLFRVRTVVYAHGNNLPDFRARSPRWVQRIIDVTLKSAAGGIVMGARLRPNLLPWLPAERIFSATDGIEPSEGSGVRTEKERVTVLYLGNLIREKGVFVLLEAAKSCPEMDFVFAGNWFRPQDEGQAKEIAGTNVKFIGPVSGTGKVRALLEADLLAFPTFYYNETLGLVLLEAMQAGLPVITTRRAAIPDIIEEGVNGLFVEEQNAEDLADKIRQLAANPLLRRNMSEENRRKFAEGYTHEHFGRRMIQAYETMAGPERT